MADVAAALPAALQVVTLAALALAAAALAAVAALRREVAGLQRALRKEPAGCEEAGPPAAAATAAPRAGGVGDVSEGVVMCAATGAGGAAEYRAQGSSSGVAVARGADAAAVLRSAVAAAAASGGGYGGHVQLEAGRFPIATPIVLPGNVTVQGRGRATELIAEVGAGGAVLTASGVTGVTVSDLSVVQRTASRAAGVSGVVLDACGDSVVERVYACGVSGYGVAVQGGTDVDSFNHIRDCRAVGCGVAGIYLAHLNGEGQGAAWRGTRPTMVSGCSVCGGGDGLLLYGATCVNITSCQTFQTTGPGFHLQKCCSTLISGCRTFQTGTDASPSPAVLTEDTHETNLSSNIFCYQSGSAIVLDGGQWAAVNANNLIDSGSTPSNAAWPGTGAVPGVELRNGQKGVQMVGNTVWNWAQAPVLPSGVAVDASCSESILASCFMNNARAAVSNAGTDITVAGVEAALPAWPLPSPDTWKPFAQVYDPSMLAAFVAKERDR